MKTFLFIFTTILSFKLFATSNLNGLWQGTGQLLIKGQSQPETCEMVLEILHTETEFSVIQSDFKCPSMHIKNKAQNKLTIKDFRLYLNNVERGYIDDNTMYSYFNTTTGLIQSYLLKYTANEKSLSYMDSIDWNSKFSTQLTGSLTLKSNP